MKLLISFVFSSLLLSCTVAKTIRFNVISNDLAIQSKNVLFGGANCEQRWETEGASIKSALANIFTRTDLGVTLKPSVDTHLVVGSLGGNSGTLISGLLQMLNFSVDLHKCARIVVVYTLNYLMESNKMLTSDEYLTFQNLLASLRKKATDSLSIEVYRLQPKCFVQTDYTHTEEAYTTQEKVAEQNAKINAMNNQDKLTRDTMDENDLYWLIQDPSVTVLLDGIVGSGAKDVTADNQHLIAIPRAQIRVMSRAIRIRQASIGDILVIVNDAASGMSETGKWVCGGGYHVNFILSSGWNKELVNVLHSRYNTEVMVLDFSYDGARFVEKLQEKVGRDNAPLLDNITDAIKIPVKHGFFKFRKSLIVTHHYYVPTV